MKLQKEIYVLEDADEPIFFTNAEECARTGSMVVLGVYKLVGKVEVSTQIKQEIVVKKSPKKAAKPPTENVPVEIRNPLLDEIRVTN